MSSGIFRDFVVNMKDVILGLGSNLGDRQNYIKTALKLLQNFFTIARQSSIYETEPVGYKDQGKFLNMVIVGETSLAPFELLTRIKEMEVQMGRKETVRWGPRIIDIDILFYGNLIINKDDLIVPHPFAHLRDFVLRPLNEIYPDFIHPILKQKISRLK